MWLRQTINTPQYHPTLSRTAAAEPPCLPHCTKQRCTSHPNPPRMRSPLDRLHTTQARQRLLPMPLPPNTPRPQRLRRPPQWCVWCHMQWGWSNNGSYRSRSSPPALQVAPPRVCGAAPFTIVLPLCNRPTRPMHHKRGAQEPREVGLVLVMARWCTRPRNSLLLQAGSDITSQHHSSPMFLPRPVISLINRGRVPHPVFCPVNVKVSWAAPKLPLRTCSVCRAASRDHRERSFVADAATPPGLWPVAVSPTQQYWRVAYRATSCGVCRRCVMAYTICAYQERVWKRSLLRQQRPAGLDQAVLCLCRCRRTLCVGSAEPLWIMVQGFVGVVALGRSVCSRVGAGGSQTAGFLKWFRVVRARTTWRKATNNMACAGSEASARRSRKRISRRYSPSPNNKPVRPGMPIADVWFCFFLLAFARRFR